MKVSRSELCRTWAARVRFLYGTEILYRLSAILHGTEPVSALTRELFILQRSLQFFFFD